MSGRLETELVVPSGLTRRLVVAAVVLILLMGASFGALLVAIAGLREADAGVTRAAAQLRSAGQLEKLLIDMETGLRGFVITGEERFLEPWTEGRAAFLRHAADLAALASDDPPQADRLQAITQAATAYVDDYATPLIDAARRDEPSASSAETTQHGKDLVDELRAQFAQFIEAERAIYLARQDGAQVAAEVATLGATIGLAASVLLIALFTAFLARTFVRPVTRAAEMAGRLAAGDLSARMVGTGTAEIGTLERAFNSLAASLQASASANAEARAELAASRARIVASADEARRRIERDLHDGAQQRLVSLGLSLRALEGRIPSELVEVRQDTRRIAVEVTRVIDELREMSRGIYPASLSRGGLPAAIRTLARRSPIPVQLEIRTEAPLPGPVQAAGYYVVAEALTNAAKHAGAREVHIRLEDHDGQVRLAIRDDGVGGADARGSGLIGLRDRVEALGGHLEIASPPGRGTALVAEIPYH